MEILDRLGLNPSMWATSIKFFLFAIFISGILVIVNAILSANTLGGELGKGLKKIAAGTITYVILFLTLTLIENQSIDLLTGDKTRVYFMFINLFGSLLLISGYIQIYRISKKLKLF